MGAITSSLRWPWPLCLLYNNKKDEYTFGGPMDLSNARSYGTRLPRKRPEATVRQLRQLRVIYRTNPNINKRASWSNFNPRANFTSGSNQASSITHESNISSSSSSNSNDTACAAAATDLTINLLEAPLPPTTAPIPTPTQAPRPRCPTLMPRKSASLPPPPQPPTSPSPEPPVQRLPSPNRNTHPWQHYNIHAGPSSPPYRTIDMLSFSAATLLESKNRMLLRGTNEKESTPNPPFTHVLVSIVLIRKTWVGAPAPRNSPASDQTSTPENLPYHHDTGTKRDILLLQNPAGALASPSEYILPTTIVLSSDPSIKEAIKRELFTKTGLEGNYYIELGFSELEAWDGDGAERGVWLCYGMEIRKGNGGRRRMGDGVSEDDESERERVGEEGWWVREEDWKGLKMGEGMRNWVKVKLGMEDGEGFKR